MFNDLRLLVDKGYTVQFGKRAIDDDYWAQVFHWSRQDECDGLTINGYEDAFHAETLAGALSLAIEAVTP
jgi:hypothetical protein